MTVNVTQARRRVRVPKLLLTAAIAFSLAIGTLAAAGPAANAVSQAPALGTAATFAILAGTAVTCTGGDVTGDVGVFPGTAVTQTGCPVTGTTNAGDTVAAQAQIDFAIAYNEFKALACDQTLTTLDGLTLSPGVYCFDAAATSTGGVLTLDGPSDGIWIFKASTSLTPIGGSVVMAGGGQACNVYWQTGTAVSLDNTQFLGSILAGTAITFTGVGSSLGGRALAKTAVTATGASISGDCAAQPAGLAPF